MQNLKFAVALSSFVFSLCGQEPARFESGALTTNRDFNVKFTSPAAAFLFTCKAKINETKPCGKQQNITETTVAMMARTRLLLGAGDEPSKGGGFHG